MRRRAINTSLGVGSALSRGVGGFLDSYYQAKMFGLKEQAEGRKGNELDVKRGQLDVSKGNLGLRGKELDNRKIEESGRNSRNAATQTNKIFGLFAGDRADEAPQQYGAAYGAMLRGDPSFVDELGAARAVSEGQRSREAGRVSGSRAAAQYGARSRQQKVDREQQFKTREAINSKGAIPLPPEGERFYPAQEHKVTQDEINQRTAAGLSGDRIRRLRASIANQGGMVDPQLFLSAMDEVEEITGRQGLTDDEVADYLNIPGDARQELYQQLDALEAQIKPQ